MKLTRAGTPINTSLPYAPHFESIGIDYREPHVYVWGRGSRRPFCYFWVVNESQSFIIGYRWANRRAGSPFGPPGAWETHDPIWWIEKSTIRYRETATLVNGRLTSEGNHHDEADDV